jgi:5-(carboxyamino)imidazole ribonucleotide synthase
MAILPGATIGILGGGQLGRMTAMAARSLGYHLQVLDPDPSCAARFVVDKLVTAPFDDDIAAAYLARECAVVTLEIEKIATASLEAAKKRAPVRPGVEVLHVIQDRARQKRWLADNGFPVGPWASANSEEQLLEATSALGPECFVKSCAGGYDGRGQVHVRGGKADGAWDELGREPVVIEKALPLVAELSVLVARRPSGEIAVYPPALNHHEERILAWSVIPAPLPRRVLDQAAEIARGIADAMKVEGLLVLELFLLPDDRLLVNELAPRPHNSFHATEIACPTSQFEQHVRAVCDLPLGEVSIVRPAAIVNLLGDLWLGPTPPDVEGALALPNVRLHLYGKRVPRAGRKMGHLSAAGPTPEEAVALVKEAAKRLTGG